MQNQKTKTIGYALACLALTACGGSGSTPPTQLQNLLSQVNSNENIISSTFVTTGSTPIRASDSVAISGGGGQFIMTVNGRSYTLSDTREVLQQHFIYSPTGNAFAARLERTDLSSGLDPNTPKDYLLFTYVASEDNFGSIGDFVTGIQTPPSAIPTEASATYTGRVYTGALDGSVLPTIGIVFGIEGDMNMEVDFARGRVSGEFTNIEDSNGLLIIPSTAEITFNETAFASDGSYNGTVTLSSNLISALDIQNITGNAVYRGDTYGSNADSLAGILEFNGTVATGSKVFYAGGGFYADRE